MKRYKDIYNKYFFWGLIACAQIIYYSCTKFYSLYPDSTTYLAYSFKDLLNGIPNEARVPVYPLICRLFYYLAGEGLYLYFVVCFQIVVSFISLYYLYKTFNMLHINKIISSIFLLIYGTSPTVIGWNTVILTESLALSGTIFFGYFVISYLSSPSIDLNGCKAAIGTREWLGDCLWGGGYKSVLCSLILTFLRPTFLLFFGILLFFWIIRFIFVPSERANIKKIILLQLFSSTIIVLYAYLVYLRYGIFTLSCTMVYQQLVVLIRNGLYENCSNADFVQACSYIAQDKGDNLRSLLVGEVSPILTQFGHTRANELIKECLKENWLLYIRYLILSIIKDSPLVLVSYARIKSNPVSSLVNLCYGTIMNIYLIKHIYILGLGEGILFIYNIKKDCMKTWVSLGLAVFLLCILFTTYVGTCSEFGRTVIHVIPFMVISSALWLQRLVNICNEQPSAVERGALGNV